MLGVVLAGVIAVIDDQRRVERTIELETGVGVKEMRTGVGHEEPVGEALSGCDC